MSRTPNAVVSLRQLHKEYGSGNNRVIALRDITIDFKSGTLTAIMGPSGSGKSTLLQCAAGLDQPTSGLVVIAGTDISELSETKRTRLRREAVGFIFQSFNLVSALTAEENVVLPLRLAGHKTERPEALAMLDAVGLRERAQHRPAQLSGGQQQRVAIARALMTKPAVLFADEPTGALDSKASRGMLQLMRDLVDNQQQTVIMVTHDPMAASYADRVVFLADGQIAGELPRSTPARIASRMARMEGASA